MVKKKKTESKKTESKQKEERKVRGFVNYAVYDDSSATVNCQCSDKELIALMLILYKRLDENERKVINAVIRTMSLIDNI